MPHSNFLSAGWNCFRTVQLIYKYLSVQKKFLRGNIQPILHSHYAVNDGSLDATDLKKINHYYGLAVPAILGEAICTLHGKRMSNDERWAATSQGAMTGLFDDFFDRQYLSEESIKELMESADTGKHKKSNEKLFDEFYRKVLQVSPRPNLVRSTLEQVYDAQIWSKKQHTTGISKEEIESVTKQKGGVSLLFYRSVFLPVASPSEEKLFFGLGGLMQLCNDIFDVYKDREAGIKTLLTEATHIDDLKIYLKKELSDNFRLAYQIGLPEKNVQHFLSIITLAIFSRAFVCLDQMEANEKYTNGVFKVSQYSRKQLICDMDTIRNMLRSAKYTMNFGKVL